MREGLPQDPRYARRSDDDESRDAGGFWRSLPGILTAAGSFLAGLAGLAAVIVPNFYGKRNSPAVSEQVARPASATTGELGNSSSPGTTAPAASTPGPAAPATTAPAAASASEPAVPRPAPVRAEAARPSRGRYIAAYASDGFVVLRSQPTTASVEMTRVLVGEAVRCGQANWQADGYRWRRCIDQDGNVGFMSDTFLREE